MRGAERCFGSNVMQRVLEARAAWAYRRKISSQIALKESTSGVAGWTIGIGSFGSYRVSRCRTRSGKQSCLGQSMTCSMQNPGNCPRVVPNCAILSGSGIAQPLGSLARFFPRPSGGESGWISPGHLGVGSRPDQARALPKHFRTECAVN